MDIAGQRAGRSSAYRGHPYLLTRLVVRDTPRRKHLGAARTSTDRTYNTVLKNPRSWWADTQPVTASCTPISRRDSMNGESK